MVDVHIHTAPPRLVERIQRGRFPHVRVRRDGDALRFSFPWIEESPKAPAALTDFGGLAKRGVEAGVDVQLAGPWTDLFGYTLPEETAVTWSRAYNEELAEECALHAGLEPMATIPLRYPGAAVKVLEHAHSLGCRGAMIGTDIPDGWIDSVALEAVWEAAAGLGMPLLLHPTFLRIPRAMEQMGLKNAVERIGAITTALTRLVYSGVLLKYPELVIVAALGGGAFIPARRRVLRNHELGWSESSIDVEAAMSRLYFDTVVLDPALLTYLISQMGADRFVMGSDYPFPWEPDPVGTVTRACTAQDKPLVLGKTASHLFGI